MIPEKATSYGEAIYPLTVFDNLFERIGVSMGWLVEGNVNLDKLEDALDKVVSKWPLLAGRLENVGRKFYIRIPLDTYSVGYERYRLTSSDSHNPLSDYVTLPVPLVSDALPYTLFKHPNAPSTTVEWIKYKHPVMHWHVTRFRDGDNSYSCIGLTFAHVLFDGLGIASVVHAVEAELLGKPWGPIPLPLSPGKNVNLMDKTLDKVAMEMGGTEVFAKQPYNATSLVGLWWILKFLAWCVWQEKWHGSKRKVMLFPPKAITKLVEDTRQAAIAAGKGDIRLTRGDVLAAFLFKTVYSDGTNPQEPVHMSSLASIRRFFDGKLNAYPHNCVIPLPYQIYTVGRVNATTLAELSYEFAQSRLSFTFEESLRAREALRKVHETSLNPLPFLTDFRESVSLSNMCIANIVNIDWSGSGAGRTICRYKSMLANHPINLTNLITIVGYLDDGSLLLDVHFIQRRLDRLQAEIERLVKETEMAT